MIRKVRRESTKSRVRGRTVQRAEPSSCFDCWRMKRECSKGTLQGSCTRCNKLGPRDLIQNAPSLQMSNANSYLRELVESTPSISDSLHLSCLITITTTQPNGIKAPTRIDISEPFYPSSKTLAGQIDTMVRNILGLKIRGKDNSSDLVSRACLAGSYLSIMFQSRDDSISSILPDMSNMVVESTETTMKRHIVKFSIIRFDELSQELMLALRASDTVDIDATRSVNIIAAAGVLYCELDHVKQRFLDGKLELLGIDSSLLGLQNALKSWLAELGKEILSRLQKTCGAIRSWADGLHYPWIDARRTFDVRNITLKTDWTSQKALDLHLQETSDFDSRSTSNFTSPSVSDEHLNWQAENSDSIPGQPPIADDALGGDSIQKPPAQVTKEVFDQWSLQSPESVSFYAENLTPSAPLALSAIALPSAQTLPFQTSDATKSAAQIFGDPFQIGHFPSTHQTSWLQSPFMTTNLPQPINFPVVDTDMQAITNLHCPCCPQQTAYTLRRLNSEPQFTYGPTVLH